MRIRTFLITCLAAFTVFGAGAATSQAANVANLEVQVLDSNGNPYWAPCEYSFDRSSWSGGGSSWSSSWTNSVEQSGDCVTDSWGSYVQMEVTKTPLYSGVGTFQANVQFSLLILGGLVSCGYGGSTNGYWVNQPGSPNQKRFMFPASSLARVRGGLLCPAPLQIRSDTPALDVLADY